MSTHQDWRDVRSCLKTPGFLEFEFRSCKDARSRLARFIRGTPRSCYALIHGLPIQEFEYFDEIVRGVRIDYYRYLELAVIYLKWPSHPHNFVLSKFRTLFTSRALAMGISLFYYLWLSNATHDGRRRNKQPDECLYTAPPDNCNWPVLVMEVGLSETMGQLRQDSLWWFSESSEVKLVLLIALNITAKEITIEKWERGRPPPSGRTTRSSTAALEPSATETVTINTSGVVGTLHLSFEKLFRASPGPTQHDFEFENELSILIRGLFHSVVCFPLKWANGRHKEESYNLLEPSL